MHKLFVIVLLACLITSCKGNIEAPTTAVDGLTPSMASPDILNSTQTSKPTNDQLVPTAISDAPVVTAEKYLKNLTQFPQRDNIFSNYSLNHRLSPNGEMVFADTTIVIEYGDPYQIYSVFDAAPLISENLYADGFLPQSGTIKTDSSFIIMNQVWSPDSQAVALIGSYIGGPLTNFVIVMDITNPEDVQKFLVSWPFHNYPYSCWSPDSQNFLIWFGPEDVLEGGHGIEPDIVEEAWVINRNTQVTSKLITTDLSSPLWFEGGLLVIKNQREIWWKDIRSDVERKLYACDFDVDRLLGYDEKGGKLLLGTMTDPIKIRVLDLKQDKVTVELDFDEHYIVPTSFHGTQTTVNMTIIWTLSDGLTVFDWDREELKKLCEDGRPVGWSPILNGFIVGPAEHETDFRVVYP